MPLLLKPGGIIQSTAKFHNVPWRGDKIAIEWPQTQEPTATSPFRNLYQVFRWPTAAKNPPKGSKISHLVKIEKLAGMIWEAVDVGHTVCDILTCKFVSPDVTKLVGKLIKIKTIGDLGHVIAEAITLGNDLSALNKAIKGHAKGKPYSAQAKRLAKKSWNDTRALHETLDGLVPGLEAVWPVPPPK